VSVFSATNLGPGALGECHDAGVAGDLGVVAGVIVDAEFLCHLGGDFGCSGVQVAHGESNLRIRGERAAAGLRERRGWSTTPR
jgi:hypothetical protein